MAIKEKIYFLFRPWLWPGYVFTKLAKPLPWPVALTNYIFQRILRVNSNYPFSINFTSRVTGSVSIGQGVATYFAVSGGCYIQGANGIEIGDFSIFAPGVRLISANHSVDAYDKWDTAPPLRIGKSVWLGANAIVLPGVQIGDYAVVGAGAIVTRNVPAGAIVAGNPARIIKFKEGYEE